MKLRRGVAAFFVLDALLAATALVALYGSLKLWIWFVKWCVRQP